MPTERLLPQIALHRGASASSEAVAVLRRKRFVLQYNVGVPDRGWLLVFKSPLIVF